MKCVQEKVQGARLIFSWREWKNKSFIKTPLSVWIKHFLSVCTLGWLKTETLNWQEGWGAIGFVWVNWQSKAHSSWISQNKLIDTTKLLTTPRTSLPPFTLAVIMALWAVRQLLRYFRKEEGKNYLYIAVQVLKISTVFSPPWVGYI